MSLFYKQYFFLIVAFPLKHYILQILRPVFYDHIIDVCQPPFNVVPNPNRDWNTNVVGLIRALDSAKVKSGWKCIYFSQAGTYKFGSTINLGPLDNNIVIKG